MSTPVLSDKTTHGIRVGATAAYAADESDPAGGRYVFRYTVIIANVGDAAAKLVSRHWVIIDGDGKREDVEGPGVVGRTPRLGPGQSFRYQSYCPLPTPWGTMEGTYHMARDDGATFDAAVERFYLRGSTDGSTAGSPAAAGDEAE